MTTTLKRHGDQWVVVLDDSLLASLNIGPQTPLEVTSDGAALSIRPASPTPPSFEEALEIGNTRHGGALKKLAE